MQAYRDWVAFNGGDPAALDDFSRLPGASVRQAVKADRAGWIHGVDSRALGLYAIGALAVVLQQVVVRRVTSCSPGD